MKYKIKLESTIDLPDNTKYILIYTKKCGSTAVYPISKIIRQTGRHLFAEVLNKGPRTFINQSIINLAPVEN